MNIRPDNLYMRPFVLAGVLCLLAAGSSLAASVTLPGPTLLYDIGGWNDSGMQFTALADVRLVSFTFENQGAADTIWLLDDSSNILQTYSAPAGDPMHTVVVNWPLSSGQTYRLISDDPSNGRWVSYSSFPTANAHLSVQGVWSESNQRLYTSWWFTFTDLTTSDDSVVPEPSSMVLSGLGLAALAWMRKRRRA